MSADMLTTADVAALVGVSPATIRSYAARGIFPKPDGYLGRTPWWHKKTVQTWATNRTGQGKGGGRPRKVSPIARDGSEPGRTSAGHCIACGTLARSVHYPGCWVTESLIAPAPQAYGPSVSAPARVPSSDSAPSAPEREQ